MLKYLASNHDETVFKRSDCEACCFVLCIAAAAGAASAHACTQAFDAIKQLASATSVHLCIAVQLATALAVAAFGGPDMFNAPRSNSLTV